MPETVLTDVAADAERILNRLLAGSRTCSTEPAAMGWIIRFAISGQPAAVLRSTTLRLEHSCEESVKSAPEEPWVADPGKVESLMRAVPGVALDSLRVAQDGELHIGWQCGASLRLRSTHYSMDWQWQIAPDEGVGPDRFSVVSVQGEKVWTRYPPEVDHLGPQSAVDPA